MKTHHTTLPLSFARGLVLFAVAGALMLPVVATTARATDTATLERLANQAAALPMKAKFVKSKSATAEAPYVLHLKNTSKQPLTVSATVNTSVPVHNRPKTREVPAQVVEPGKMIMIENLAAQDTVTVTAEGFEPLKLTAP